MARLGIAGLTGSVSLTIETSGGESEALAASVAPVALEPTSVAVYPGVSINLPGIGLNLTGMKGTRLNSSGASQQPPRIGTMLLADQVSGDTLFWSRFSSPAPRSGSSQALSSADQIEGAVYLGAEIDAYRIVSGTMIHLGRRRVVSTYMHRLASLIGTSSVIAPGVAQAEFRIVDSGTNMWGPWVPHAFSRQVGVFAVGASGAIGPGPLSAPSVTVAARPRSANAVTNTTVAQTVNRFALNEALPRASNIAVEQLQPFRWRVTWTEPEDMTGVVGWTLLLAPDVTVEQGCSMTLAAGGPAIQPGDLLVINCPMLEPSREMLDIREVPTGVANPVHPGSALIPGPRIEDVAAPLTAQRYYLHDDLPAIIALTPAPGDGYRRLSLSGATNYSISAGVEAGALEAGVTYRMDFLARCPSGSLSMTIRRSAATEHALTDVAVGAVPSEWTRYTYDFTPAAASATAPGTGILLSGSGDFDLCALGVWDASTFHADPAQIDYETFLREPVPMIRHHALIKSIKRLYSIRQILSEPRGNRDNAASRQQNSVPTACRIANSFGADLWLQLDVYIGASDMAAVMEYLAEPYDPETDTPQTKPWAALRHQQGRTAPWTDAFNEIIFECGNEVWGFDTFRPWVFEIPMKDSVTAANVGTYSVGGKYFECLAQAIKATPQWASVANKWKFVVGGQASYSVATIDIMSNFPSCNVVSIANYVGGGDGGGVNADSLQLDHYRRATMFGPQTFVQHIRNLDAARNSFAATHGARPEMACYEYGPGAAFPGTYNSNLPRLRREDEVLKSRAVGVGVFADTLMLAVQEGMRRQMYFQGEREISATASRFTSHSNNGRPWPIWEMVRLLNATMGGDLKRLQVQARRTYRVPGRTNYPAVDVPLVEVYASQREGQYSIAVINRGMPWAAFATSGGNLGTMFDAPNDWLATESGYETVLVRFPPPSGSLTLRAFANPTGTLGATEHNLDNGVITWTETALATPSQGVMRLSGDDAAAWGLTADGVPPCSVHVWTWE